MGGKVGLGDVVGVTTVLGSEARDRGSAESFGRRITPTMRRIRTITMGKSALRVFSLLLDGFTISIWQIFFETASNFVFNLKYKNPRQLAGYLVMFFIGYCGKGERETHP